MSKERVVRRVCDGWPEGLAQQCEALLSAAGIQAIVTSRAKHPDSLRRKLLSRSATRIYASMKDIQLDIVDLAGVRIALYFPGDREEVGKLLRTQFVLVSEPRVFPDGSPAKYSKRFSGYNAIHYRVQLKEVNLLESQKRYAEARVDRSRLAPGKGLTVAPMRPDVFPSV